VACFEGHERTAGTRGAPSWYPGISIGGGGAGASPVVAYTAFGDPVTWDEGAETWRVGWPVDLGTRYQYDGGWGYESGAWGPGPGGQGAVAGPLALWGENTTLPPVTLQHVGWRWYQPSIGRFVQRDRIGLEGGLNAYEYCDSNPTDASDPAGLLPRGALEMGAVWRGWYEGGKSVEEATNLTARWAIETGMIETLCVFVPGGSGRTFSGFTGHGLKRLIERGLTRSVIQNAIRHGTRTVQADGTIKYVYENVVVITNAAGQVVTCFKTGH